MFGLVLAAYLRHSSYFVDIELITQDLSTLQVAKVSMVKNF